MLAALHQLARSFSLRWVAEAKINNAKHRDSFSVAASPTLEAAHSRGVNVHYSLIADLQLSQPARFVPEADITGIMLYC